jgi:VWFA-related protein
MRRTGLIVLALVLGVTHVGTAQQDAGQQPAAEPQQPVFRAGINFVRVDVVATDGQDRPVTDLTQADFEVFEDDQRQTIEQFRLIRVDGNLRPGDPQPRAIRTQSDEEVELSREDARVFVFFLDDYHVRRANSVRVREMLARFVQQQLRPRDIVGIMYPLTPLDALGFTYDHAATARSLMQFDGRKYDYTPRNPIEAEYVRRRLSADQVEQLRNQVTMSALRALATRLGGLREGRKSIIFVSEGFTGLLPPQMRTDDASLPPGLINPNARSSAAGENSDREQAVAFFSQAEVERRLREVFGDANRNNASIYTVDPRGLAASEFGIDENVGPRQDSSTLRWSQSTLRWLAEETDGRAIVSTNDIGPGLAQAVQDASFYYLLGYSSTAAPTDGRFHEIRVRVRRPGVEVRARRGYWAFTADDVVKATTPGPEIARPVQEALATISPSVLAGRYVRTWIGTERGENGRTKITLVWEAVPPQANVRRDAAGRVSVLAADSGGNLVFRGRTPETPAPATNGGRGGTAGQSAAGLHRLVFEAPPGELELRLTVEGAEGVGTLDTETRRVPVPDLTAPDAAMSTPRVYRGRTARELQSIAANPDAVPVAAREFSRAERLLVRFDVYGNATASAALLNRGGTRMADVPVAAVGGSTHQLELGLNTVPGGDYLLEITANGAGGEVKELIAFRIGS